MATKFNFDHFAKGLLGAFLLIAGLNIVFESLAYTIVGFVFDYMLPDITNLIFTIPLVMFVLGSLFTIFGIAWFFKYGGWVSRLLVAVSCIPLLLTGVALAFFTLTATGVATIAFGLLVSFMILAFAVGLIQMSLGIKIIPFVNELVTSFVIVAGMFTGARYTGKRVLGIEHTGGRLRRKLLGG